MSSLELAAALIVWIVISGTDGRVLRGGADSRGETVTGHCGITGYMHARINALCWNRLKWGKRNARVCLSWGIRKVVL